MPGVTKLLALVPAVLLAACAGHAPPRPPPVAPPPPAAAAPEPPAPPVATSAPPRTDVLLARARALRAEGDVAGARARLEAALEADPTAPAVRVELADVLVVEGHELDRAASLLDGLAETPDGRVSLARARLCEARADDVAAADLYAAALAATDDPEARLRRALALERLGRSGEEIAELERLRAVRPGDAFVRAHLGDAYDEAGRRQEAEVELRWVAEAQPDRPAGWLRLARFYERAGRPREAREAAERAKAVAGARPERRLRPLLPSKS
jgi:predicted Zn-dependent protease